MIVAPIPPDEADRLADVHALRLLDTPQEERFDRIVRLAAHVFDVPIAYIALIDANRQWFKAKCGLDLEQTERQASFCGHAIIDDRPLVVSDAYQDERFRDNPLVLGPPRIRFYAGHPLRGPKGRKVGTLCLASSRARPFDERDHAMLAEIAAIAEHELNMMDVIHAQRALLETKQALIDSRSILARELAEAAGYVRSLLPARLTVGPVRTDWQFITSSQLGGDLFGYHWLDEDRLAIYLLDVCGHGVGPSLLASSVLDAIRSGSLSGAALDQPAEVLAALNSAYQMSAHDDKFFTIWYGVYESPTRRLTYATAGHPPALLMGPVAREPIRLGMPNFMIGVVPGAKFQQAARTVAMGSRLYLFSDGLLDAPLSSGGRLGLQGLSGTLSKVSGHRKERLSRLIRLVQERQGWDEFDDDVSLLEVEFF